MVRVYSKMETHVDGKAKVFSKESLMLSQNKDKEQVCRYLKSNRPVSLMQKN